MRRLLSAAQVHRKEAAEEARIESRVAAMEKSAESVDVAGLDAKHRRILKDMKKEISDQNQRAARQANEVGKPLPVRNWNTVFFGSTLSNIPCGQTTTTLFSPLSRCLPHGSMPHLDGKTRRPSPPVP